MRSAASACRDPSRAPDRPVASSAPSALIPVGAADHALGPEEPELTLVEYGDFGCPFCFAASRPVKSLLERYDTLRLVWRHFPDSELHPGADLAAELSELAAESGVFWQAHSLLLAGREHFTPEELFSVARRLDLDLAEAESTLRERTYRERVLEDVAGAESAGVHATPTFFLGRERLEGHWSQLAQLVPAALQKERQP
jgi:protein-disulfide isomerase